MEVNRKDLASGAIFAAVGVVYGTIAWKSLPIGQALNMGPGYFPIILSAILIILGGVIIVRAWSTSSETPFGVVPWRGIVMLSAATLVFAAFLDDLGLFPCVWLTSFLASLSSPQIGILRGLLISLAIAAFCTLIFSYGINLPVPRIGPVFSF